MKHRLLHEKNRGKNRKKFPSEKYPILRKRQNRRKADVLTIFTIRNYAKESSHVGEFFFQQGGDDL